MKEELTLRTFIVHSSSFTMMLTRHRSSNPDDQQPAGEDDGISASEDAEEGDDGREGEGNAIEGE
jgi:hypothetical protein